MGHPAFIHVGHHQQHVRILQGGLDKLHHALLQLVGGVEDARRVAVDNLIGIFVDDAHDAVTCGLGLRIDDAQTFPHQTVHQRAFAHVGGAHNVDEASAMAVLCRRSWKGLIVRHRRQIEASKVRFRLRKRVEKFA